MAATSLLRLGTGRGSPRGGHRRSSAPRRPEGCSAPVLGGHRSLLKLSRPIPTSPGHCECQAQPPRQLPGLFLEQIPFPGCKTLRSRQGRAGAGAGAISRDDTRPSNIQKLRRGAEQSCCSRRGEGGGGGRHHGWLQHRDPPAHPPAGALPYCWSHMMRWKRYL